VVGLNDDEHLDYDEAASQGDPHDTRRRTGIEKPAHLVVGHDDDECEYRYDEGTAAGTGRHFDGG
jgi:hypothetical protein